MAVQVDRDPDTDITSIRMTRDEAEDLERQLRALCYHGTGYNGTVISRVLKPLQDALEGAAR